MSASLELSEKEYKNAGIRLAAQGIFEQVMEYEEDAKCSEDIAEALIVMLLRRYPALVKRVKVEFT